MKVEHFYGANKILQKSMYDLRRSNFAEFSPEEQMVYWQFDPLSEHFIVFDGETPLGSISVGNYSEYLDVHKQFGLDKLIKGYSPILKIKGVHRLATIPEVRGNILVLRNLLKVAEEETRKDCDFFFGYTAPSKNTPGDISRFELGEKYCSISNAKSIGRRVYQGVEQHFFGKWV